MKFDPNPKQGKTKKATAKGISSPQPTNGQAALNNSVQVKSTSPRRVGVDKVNGEIVVLDEHLPDHFHGHVRIWDDLTLEMQKVLKNAGFVDKNGNIL